jgi:cytochrome c oxidase assembly factor CtaG
VIAAIIGAYAVAYLIRARTLARRGRPVPVWRIVCFAGGLLVLAVAFSPPLGGRDETRLSAHMAEHLLIGDIASLLLVLGLTGPLLAPLLRLPLVGRLRALSHPLIALGLWAANLWLWHLPALYEAAVRHDLLHVVQHGLFLLLGANLWMPLFGPFPKPHWFGGAAQLGYVLVARVSSAVLANLFVWSQTVFYPSYGDLADQSAAGAIMMAEESVLMVALLGWLAARWIRDAGERQELVELATAHGVSIDERRVARAVAAGHGAELRRRLHGQPSPD